MNLPTPVGHYRFDVILTRSGLSRSKFNRAYNRKYIIRNSAQQGQSPCLFGSDRKVAGDGKYTCRTSATVYDLNSKGDGESNIEFEIGSEGFLSRTGRSVDNNSISAIAQELDPSIPKGGDVGGGERDLI